MSRLFFGLLGDDGVVGGSDLLQGEFFLVGLVALEALGVVAADDGFGEELFPAVVADLDAVSDFIFGVGEESGEWEEAFAGLVS